MFCYGKFDAHWKKQGLMRIVIMPFFNQPKKNHHEIKSKFLLGQVPAHLGNYRNVVSRGSRNDIWSKRTIWIATSRRNECFLHPLDCHYWVEVLFKAALDSPVNKHGSDILYCRSDNDFNCNRRWLWWDYHVTCMFISHIVIAQYLTDSRSQLSDVEKTTFFVKP